MNKTNTLFIVAIVFVTSVILVQTTPIYIGLAAALLVAMFYLFSSNDNKGVLLTITLYIAGFWISFYLASFFRYSINASAETEIILSRFSLLGYIAPLSVLAMIYKTKTNYVSAGSFSSTVRPLIWRGFPEPVWRFLIVFSLVAIASFSFAIDFHREDFYLLLYYGLLFALVNSVLEELLWRGYMLSRFVDYFGEKLGLVVTSLGFGLYHYSIGFPWLICISFSLFGMLMGGMAIKSNGLLPVIVMHFVMNVLFALSGMIF
ncbi:CPBP family intramembrane glutamic endopeptidase [Paenibacillus alkalitolerans]|uniref:CPBP family intramembrane glutamic endopeptidase n=1 Tax=Paenibacillus alkalitolerans TaxID=2799335 RepID=UPI0018F3C468|nr:type II CAAX endopeptidase family protein [Paenibacillus alkalitolerans]